MKRWILRVAAGIAICAAPAGAHHSISGAYDTRREITVKGVIKQFQFVNPHPFVTMDVKNGSDNSAWVLEMDNRSELAHAGMTSQTLLPGDEIVVTGSPAPAGRQALYIKRLDRPADGFWYEQVGSRPRIRGGR